LTDYLNENQFHLFSTGGNPPGFFISDSCQKHASKNANFPQGPEIIGDKTNNTSSVPSLTFATDFP
jgi:hypothetical protein